ncbi:MAG: sigma 54-interacting transcriptional regulator [Bacillus sp. (in: firmicutes)]
MLKAMLISAEMKDLSILNTLMEIECIQIGMIVDPDENAPGIQLAKQRNIRTNNDWKKILDNTYDIIIDVTYCQTTIRELLAYKSAHTIVMSGKEAERLLTWIKENEQMIQLLTQESYRNDLIFNSTEEGMVVIDVQGIITLCNTSAEKIIGIKREDALGRHVREVIPNTRLPIVLKTKQVESNQEQDLNNGMKIITTRIPMLNNQNEIIGAFAVFKDISEVVNLAEEITNLKEIQTMLQAIIQSSEDAISVVDENGRGILINRAYSKITGLTEEQVIGKPATTDIYEGESVHMKVLQTRKSVRGAKMFVGPNKKEVIVNVAPVIVNGVLKGSVGVIHDLSVIKDLTTQLNRARQIIRTLEAKYTFEDIVGHSEQMCTAIEQGKICAKTPVNVLLRGESGTGKELFAHAIHNESNRKYNKFIRVNCAALTESLLESELFGYEDGAFSGAKRGGKKGLFEEANHGSIFLDEIGEMSLNTQVKLLRVLQENEIIKVGGVNPISINVRVIAATNVNLEEAIVKGTFREDLYYRLNQMPIYIPTLRNRIDDLPILCHHLLQKLNGEYGRNITGISQAAMERFKLYHWPGNVRELENVLSRAIIFMKYNETIIEVAHIADFLQLHPSGQRNEKREEKEMLTLSEKLEQYEKMIIHDCLCKNRGNKTATAKELGISIRNLYYKIEKLGLEETSMQNFS